MRDEELHKILRSKLEGHEVSPDEGLWAAIEQELDNADNKARPLFPWRYLVAASVVLLLSVGAGFLIFNNDTPGTNQASVQTTTGDNDNNVDNNEDKPVITDTTSTSTKQQQQPLEEPATDKQVINNKRKETLKRAAGAPSKNTIADNPNITNNRTGENAPADSAQNDAQKQEADNDNSQLREHEPAVADDTGSKYTNTRTAYDDSENIYIVKPGNSNKTALAMHVGGISAQSYSQENLPSGSSNMMLRSMGVIDRYSSSAYEEEHNMPLTFGLSVRKDLSKRFAIETGVTYSYLYSKFIWPTYTEKQQLHYIGIPVSGIFKVKDWNGFAVYLAAGGSVKKNIAGKQVTGSRLNSGNENTDNSYTTNRLQWSFDTRIGVSYQFYKQLAVYAEPGWSYYFDNNSTIRTIWDQSPSQFTLQIGFRLDL